MRKSLCYEGDQGLKRGPWTPEEDHKLLSYIKQHGHGSWRFLPKKAGLQRCGKSCRLRWTNYLRPDIKRGKFSLNEERTIIQLHALLGNRWSAIATHLPKRTDNEIKNYWNTHLKKRLAMMGIDPMTHKPSHETLGSNISHMAQWERTRLEAEARLVRESKLVNQTNHNDNDDDNDSFKMLSSEQILKKMPTTFAPPRWHTRLFFASSSLLQGNDCFGQLFTSDHHAKSDGSQRIISAREFGGSDGSDLEAVVGDDYWNNLVDNHDHQDYHSHVDRNLIETSFDLINDQVNKSGTYWSDILNFVNYCGPSNLPVF